MRSTSRSILGLAGLALAAAPVSAQIRASERATISQTVDGTVISLDYARPQVRGRSEVFGGIVPWGKQWTPGANWATTLTVSSDVTINGQPLAAGGYSLWFIVEQDQWTMVLDPTTKLFHLSPPAESSEQLRLGVTPESGPYTEILEFRFTEISATGTKLQLNWGDTEVALDIGVPPSHDMTFSADSAAAYLGSYSLPWGPEDNRQETEITIYHEDGRLWARWDPSPLPNFDLMLFVWINDGWFNPGQWVDGSLQDVVVDVVFEFVVEDGKATGFELRGPGDRLLATGTRK